jgi:hypothetical protein
MVVGGIQHVSAFSFICRRHHDHIGQAAKKSEIESALVGWPICADNAGAVYGQRYIQSLNADIMYQLIVSSL